MQSIFQSISNFVSDQFNDTQAVKGTADLAASLEVTKADVLQAEEAERDRRIKSYEFKECALANAKFASNLVKTAGFPQLVYQQGSKKRTRIIEERERTRRLQNLEECDARRQVCRTTSGLITSLGWPFMRTKPVDPEPSATKKEIDDSINRLTLLVAQQALSNAKRLEEEERVRRETDAQGQLKLIQNASRVSLDVEGHMVDAVTREERERDRRSNSLSESVAKSNANAVARIVQTYREETLVQAQETSRRAGAKIISDMILDARRAFELSRNNNANSNTVLVRSSDDQPLDTASRTPLVDIQSVQSVQNPVYVVPSTYAVAPHYVAPATMMTAGPSVLPPTALSTIGVVPADNSIVAPAVTVDSARAPEAAKIPNQVTFARTFSTAGSMSPTIFPLRRSTPVASSEMRPAENSISNPRYKVVIVPDPTTPLDSNRNSKAFKAPELARTTSEGALFAKAAPQNFVAHPLSRSLSTHELSFIKKEAKKHEKMGAKQTKQAEKLMNKSEKLKSKGKLEKAKTKQLKAFELRKEAMKHEEIAHKSKFGSVVLTPAPPSM